MSKELSNAAKDALVNKGIDDAKKGEYNPPNSGILESIRSAVADSKETKEESKAERDAYNEGHRVGGKL